MKLNLKSLAVTLTMALTMLFTSNVSAQSSCCGGENHDEATCSVDHEKDSKASGTVSASDETTSGCAPSSCRGAQTKFGEAKVITTLRNTLVALKSNMEVHKAISFDNRSYDIHGIVGESDEESLQIIAKEVELIENDFSSKLNTKFEAFQLPENSAKIVQYLTGRIKSLQDSL